MRNWTRANQNMFCGYCANREIAKGDAYQLVQLFDVKRQLVRCVECADGPPPADLPPFVERSHEPVSTTPLKTAKPARLDEWMPFPQELD